MESRKELVEDRAEFEVNSESLDAQLDRLADALAQQTEQGLALEPLLPEVSQNDSAVELERQIEEDRLLAAQESALELIAAEEAPAFPILFDTEAVQASIETLLFLSDKPLSLEKLHQLLGPNSPTSVFEEAVQGLVKRYRESAHGIEIAEIAGGYQFRTKSEYAGLAQKLVKVQTQRLSSGAMETLAIIAYRQPVMKDEIDQVRGVDSSHFIRGLLDKKLIQITGRSELPGRPMLYSTTGEFLELFGLRDYAGLPSLREIEQMIPGSQAGNPEEEDPRVREMRRMVKDMKMDQSANLAYNPKEDEKILKEFRERVNSIPTSTPYLDQLDDEMNAAELLAQEQEQLQGQSGVDLNP